MEQNIEQKEKLSLISKLGRYEKIERDSEVSYKIYMSADNFKVVQTTDMHFSNINFQHKKMLKKVDALIRSIEPNLIVNTGDYFGNVAPFYAKLLLKELEKYTSYPWAFAWGNHDLDLYQYKLFFKNYERIEQLLESLPKSLYLRTGDYFDQFKNKSLDKDEKERKACIDPIEKGLKKEGDRYIVVDKGSFKRYDGFYGGNYLLKIFNSSKKHVWNLFILNSRRWASIPPVVLDWMESEIKKESVPSIAFYHVPDYAYQMVLDNGSAKGIYREKVCYEKEDGRVHRRFVEMGSVVATFVGHDHVNDYHAILDGIDVVYGRKTTTFGYGGRDRKNFEKLHRKGIHAIIWGVKYIELPLNYYENGPKEHETNKKIYPKHYSILYDGERWDYPDHLINFDFLKNKK